MKIENALKEGFLKLKQKMLLLLLILSLKTIVNATTEFVALTDPP